MDGQAKIGAVPRDFDSLRAFMVERKSDMPKRLAQVAAYSLDNPDEIAFGTAASIAASAGVQPSDLDGLLDEAGRSVDGNRGCSRPGR